MYQHALNTANVNREYEFFKTNRVGLVYDSAPGMPGDYLTLLNGATSLFAGYNKPSQYLMASLFVTFFKGYLFWSSCLNEQNYFTRFLHNLMLDSPPLPTLFLYSKSDKLIAPENIAKFIDQKRLLFPETHCKAVVYEEPEHCMIYLKHTDDYVKHIKEHLNVCKMDLPMNSIKSKL